MVRLDVGPSRSTWRMSLGCQVPLIVVLNVPALVICLMFFFSSSLAALGIVVLVPLLLADSIFVGKLTVDYRNAFWLDGRTLIRRVIIGRKHYNLAAAHISAESAQPTWAARYRQILPRLVVQVPGQAPVRLWLRDPNRGGALLPPHQLAALAQAIDPGLQHPVARRLWELASDPLGGVL